MSRKSIDLGKLLQEGRASIGLSQGDVAKKLGLTSAQCVSDWERNYGSGIPIPALKNLIQLYHLDQNMIFEALLALQSQRLKERLQAKFFDEDQKNSERKSS